MDGAPLKIDGARQARDHAKRFEGVTRKMANKLLRTARSGVVNTARDFSCALVTADCDLLTAADSYPIHVLRGADLMARAMLHFHPDIKPGDAFLHNSPYHGNTHAADHTILGARCSTTGACIASRCWRRPIRPDGATRCRRPTWARRATSIRKAR